MSMGMTRRKRSVCDARNIERHAYSASTTATSTQATDAVAAGGRRRGLRVQRCARPLLSHMIYYSLPGITPRSQAHISDAAARHRRHDDLKPSTQTARRETGERRTASGPFRTQCAQTPAVLTFPPIFGMRIVERCPR